MTASAPGGLDGAAPSRPNGDVAWDDFDTAGYVVVLGWSIDDVYVDPYRKG